MSPRRVSLGLLSALTLSACTAQIGEPYAARPDAGPDNGADGSSGELTVSNIPDDLLDLGTDSLELSEEDGLVQLDTDTGAIIRVIDGADLRPDGVTFTKLAQEGGPELAVFSATSLTIADGAKVLARGSAALVFAVGGDVSLEGAIIASGSLHAPNAPGPGGYAGGDPQTLDGQGPGGGAYGGVPDTGGGGGGHAAAGGKGGDRGQDPGGAGGEAYGSASLVPLVGGSGGGAGGGGDPYDGDGMGGGGGGAVQISARGSIHIGPLGGINCGGGGGQGGVLDDGGGGGGAGGAILLEAPQVQVQGALAANGGGGGAGADQSARGSSGQSGHFSAARPSGGPAMGEGSSGGSGGGGDELAGAPGANTDGVDLESDNAGGGGGAAGRILIRSQNDAQIDEGVVTPPASISRSTL